MQFGRLRNEAGEYSDEGGGGMADVLSHDFAGSDAETEQPYEYPGTEREDYGQPQQQQIEDPLGPAPQERPPVALTPEQWVAAQQAQMQLQTPQQQPEMTQEEINRQLNAFIPDLEFAQQLFGEDADERHVQGLQRLVEGMNKHNLTILNLTQQMLRDEYSQQLSPALEMVREQKTSAFVNELSAAYPALKGHDRVVRNVIDGLQAQGYKPKDAVEAARTVAGQVEMLLKSANPQFSLLSAPQQQQRQQTSMPQMAGLAGGNGGGPAGAANGGSGGQEKKNAWQSLWD